MLKFAVYSIHLLNFTQKFKNYLHNNKPPKAFLPIKRRPLQAQEMATASLLAAQSPIGTEWASVGGEGFAHPPLIRNF